MYARYFILDEHGNEVCCWDVNNGTSDGTYGTIGNLKIADFGQPSYFWFNNISDPDFEVLVRNIIISYNGN